MLLFLDIDGELHPVATHPDQQLAHRPRFEQWAAGHPDVQIVITSSWRQLYPLAVVKELFSSELGERVIGTTPRLIGVPTQRLVGKPEHPLRACGTRSDNCGGAGRSAGRMAVAIAVVGDL